MKNVNRKERYNDYSISEIAAVLRPQNEEVKKEIEIENSDLTREMAIEFFVAQ